MSLTKFNGTTTNANRALAGSKRGLEGREYPKAAAKRLNRDIAYRAALCRRIGKKASNFLKAVAGSDIPVKVASSCVSGGMTTTKTNLRIFWKDGTTTNFRVKTSGPAQIHLSKAENFINEFEGATHRSIPRRVKDALLLFTGSHRCQKEILDAVPVDYVGEKIRCEVERKYWNRLTLASMYGYDEEMATEFLDWFRNNAAELFVFCFSRGAEKDAANVPRYLWYHDSNELDAPFDLLDLKRIAKKISQLDSAALCDLVRPGDDEEVGSTIALPFGNLQQHLHGLQFRHSKDKLVKLAKRSARSAPRNRFGSRPKESGHENELLIAAALNERKGFRTHFCDRIGRSESEFLSATADGKHAPKEDSVTGGKTTGKTDVVVRWRNGDTTNISVKKRASGQAYLVTARNFVAVYEAQYGLKVPSDVQHALALFVGEAPDSKSILDSTALTVDGADTRALEREQNNRLVFDVIRNYDPRLATALIAWLEDRIVRVFELSFSAGAVKDHDKWADVLWYKNLVDAEGQGLDFMMPIAQIMEALGNLAGSRFVAKGPKNGGSTIQLPFGHLQYHLKQLEFYQQLTKIERLVAN